MNNSFLLCGITNSNLYSKNKRLSQSVNISMFEKSIEEMIKKRHSLLRMSEKISTNKLIIKDTYLKTTYGVIEINICFVCDENTDEITRLSEIKNHLRNLYELQGSNINLNNFSHEYKGNINFWWDINNDVMWGFDRVFMQNYLLDNINNSFRCLTDSDVVVTNLDELDYSTV